MTGTLAVFLAFVFWLTLTIPYVVARRAISRGLERDERLRETLADVDRRFNAGRFDRREL